MLSWPLALGCGLALLLSVWARGEDPTNALPRYTLTQALNRALEKNPEVLIAKKKLEEAAGAVVEARAGYLPSLTSSGRFEELEADYATLSDTIPNRRNELWSVAIRLTETLYAGGAVSGRMSIAKLNRESRMLDYQATVDRIGLETRIAFYDILRLRAQVTVHQQAIAFLDGELQNQRHRMALGTGDRLRALRAEVSLALERAALVEAQNSQNNACLTLSGLLNLPYSSAENQVPFAVDEEPIGDPPDLDLRACVARALELRPEMRLRDNDISAQKKQLIVDRSALRPKVAVFAGYDVVNEPNADAARSYYSGCLVGISATWSLFDGFATKGKMKATHARLDQAELARELAARAIQGDVVRAFHDLAQAREIIQTQRKNASLALESLHLAQTNVALGASTQLDLLQARVDLTRAQTGELNARFTHRVAQARLHRAISSRFTLHEDNPRGSAGLAGGTNAAPPPNYRSVTLAECYVQTLERNPEIRQKRAEVERATGTKLVFTARALPRLALQGTAGMSDGTLYDSGGAYALARADLSQPLFDAGLPASLRRGNLEVVIAQQNLNRTVAEQLHATRLAYLNAVLSLRLLETRRLLETNLEANRLGAQQRFDAGTVDRQHVGQAEIQLLNLQSEMATLQRQYLDAATELAERRGDELLLPGGLQLPEPRDNLEYAVLKIDLANETSRTIERRPDLVLLRALIKTATEDKRMVRSGYYPFVSLVAMSMYVPEAKVFLRRPEVVAGQEARETQTRYGAALTWQVLDNGRLTGASRQIESARQALAITLRQLEENVPRELASLAHTLESVDAKLGALRHSAAQAEEALTLVEQRLGLGEATQLEFLNAQGNLLSTRAGLLQAVFENERARAEFDRLTGRYLGIGSRPEP